MANKIHSSASEYLTVAEAAEFLGVSTATLRKWDIMGKLKPDRHSPNGRRMYRRQTLEAVVHQGSLRDKVKCTLPPKLDWNEIGPAEHFVQFYETEAYLVESVSEFLCTGLAAGDGVAVIATREHRKHIELRLKSQRLNIAAAIKRGQCVAIDAADTLAQLMVGGLPDRARFTAIVGGAIERLAQKWPRVRAFGEMAALLWKEGNCEAAVSLEELWNDLAARQTFALLCAYPMHDFGNDAATESFQEICTCHARVLPAESYALLANPDDQTRMITLLQQKANALQAEVAQRKKAERENALHLAALEESDRRKDEFLAMLAHELRNPLAPMCNAVQLLRLKHLTDPDIQWGHDVIERQVAQLSRLVDDLVDVSRISRGKINLQKEIVNLAAVVERSVEIGRPLIDARKHQLEVSLPKEVVPVEGDSVRLTQIVSNLLNNAAKYTEMGGRIWLNVEADENQATIRVRDSGAGISPEMLPHVFEMFTHVQSSLGRSEGGLGIGLCLTRRLVEMHGGRVEAASQGLGHGSEFIVRLPIAHETSQAEHLSKFQGEDRRKPAPKRILVVDDNKDAADGLAVLLRLMGHDVQAVNSGRAALEVAGERPPEVVLLDIGLPEMDGLEVARRLRQEVHLNNALLVALTGYGQEDLRVRIQEAGFNAHLVKPVDVEALHELLAYPELLAATGFPQK